MHTRHYCIRIRCLIPYQVSAHVQLSQWPFRVSLKHKRKPGYQGILNQTETFAACICCYLFLTFNSSILLCHLTCVYCEAAVWECVIDYRLIKQFKCVCHLYQQHRGFTVGQSPFAASEWSHCSTWHRDYWILLGQVLLW